MVTIERIHRAYTIEECVTVFERRIYTHYIESEKEFIIGIEDLCDTIGEENIISIQFFKDDNGDIDECIITYKE